MSPRPDPEEAEGTTATVVDAPTGDRGLSAFRPIRMRKARDEVVAVLADALRAGLYGPGDLLPNERDLAARLEVSRVVLREAIEVLRAEGIVATSRGKTGGTKVQSVAQLPRVLASLHGESTTNMRSLLEFRRMLELPTCLLAAERAGEDDLARLQELVDQFGATLDGSHAEIIQVDAQFHVATARAAGNPLLARSLDETLRQIVVLRSFFPYGFVEIKESYENQKDLMAALVSRDPKVIRSEVDRHLGALEDVVLGFSLPFPTDVLGLTG